MQYADDLPRLMKVGRIGEIKLKVERAIGLVGQWILDSGLQLAPKKTEAVIFNRWRRRDTGINFNHEQRVVET